MKGTVKQVIFSVAVNAVAFITLWVNAKNINVIGQFVFLLIPLIISIIETGVINKTFKEEEVMSAKDGPVNSMNKNNDDNSEKS